MKIISDEKQPKRRKNEKKNLQKISHEIKEETTTHSNTGFEIFESKIECDKDRTANNVEIFSIEALRDNE